MRTPLSKPKLLIMASWQTRDEPNSPLLRFVRDHANQLKKFEIHATQGTYHSILATGLYSEDEVKGHRSGPEGGVVELAAMVARKDCEVFIFLADPKDRISDVPENRALQRLCKELKIRLINTLAGAEEWVLYEAMPTLKEWRRKRRGRETGTVRGRKVSNVDERGEPIYLPVAEQTLALISHDQKKEEMVLFVNKHLDFLSQFHRILTTGTTGYLLKCLFSDKAHQKRIEKEALKQLGRDRFKELEKSVWLRRLFFCSKHDRKRLEKDALLRFGSEFKTLEEQLHIKEKEWNTSSLPKPRLKQTNRAFVKKIVPLASGPKGGDVLIANEVLNNHCHAVVFFQDPGTAQPHDPDIRLFERTCQFWSKDSRVPVGQSTERVKQAYATCVSDSKSADDWARHLKKIVLSPGYKPLVPLAHSLRQRYGLRDAVIVQVNDDSDSPSLGKALARACAGYFHRRLLTTVREGRQTRIGIGHGWTPMELMNQLKVLEKEGLLRRPPKLAGEVVWSTLVGNLTVVFTDREASVIARSFRDYYGGSVESFHASGFVRTSSSHNTIPREDQELLKALGSADLILTSAAPWNPSVTLVKETLLDRASFPEFSKSVGTVSVLFLNQDGKEVKRTHSAVGLGYEGIRRAALNGAVILMCGGRDRRRVAKAALKAGLVSVLVTTSKTAEDLLKPKPKGKRITKT